MYIWNIVIQNCINYRHAYGSIKFWDASAGTLQVLYKLKTNKVFERPASRSQDGSDDDPFAVQLLSLCPESRKLAVGGTAGYVILFKFKKQESTSETVVSYLIYVYSLMEKFLNIFFMNFKVIEKKLTSSL